MTVALSVVDLPAETVVTGPPLLDGVQIANLLRETENQRTAETHRLNRIDDYAHDKQDPAWLPLTAKVEFLELRKRSEYNLLPLVVKTTSSNLKISGYRTPGAKDDSPVWASWVAAGMVTKANQLIESSVQNGHAYAQITKGQDDDGNPTTAAVKTYSGRMAFAVYEDPTEDIYPKLVFLTTTSGKVKGIVDEYAFYTFTINSLGAVENLVAREHGMGVCPFVRLSPDLDIEGRSCGEVFPYIGVQNRLVQAILDMLVTSNYGAHRIVMAAGVEQPKDPVTKKPIPLKVSSKRILTTAASDARLSTAAGTPIDGALKVIDQAAAHLAIESRTPAQVLMSDLTNIGEGTLVASGQSHASKIADYKTMLGEQFKQLMALMAIANGQEDDPSAAIVWDDVGGRSLAQVADPLTKLAAGLGIPGEVFWRRIPGWTQADEEMANRLNKERDPVNALKAAGFKPPGIKNVPSTRDTPPQIGPGSRA